MLQREVPREEWATFLESFAAMHRGWLVRIEQFPLEGPGRELARDVALHSLRYTRAHDAATMIALATRRLEDRPLTRMIPNPEALYQLLTDEGIEEGVEIRGADGLTTRLLFRTPVPPETVDRL